MIKTEYNKNFRCQTCARNDDKEGDESEPCWETGVAGQTRK